MHHSPSSAKTGASCERKWWYEYREKRRAPEVTWVQVEAWGAEWAKHCTPNQRTLARGTATHGVLECYYEGGSPDWTTVPGELALRMRAHLPAREACLQVRIERSVGNTPYPRPAGERGADDPGEPERTTLTHDGVSWLGYVDLAAQIDPDGAEARRLFLDPAARRVLAAADGWATYDYKTSKDVNRYAITPVNALQGEDGGQGVLYALDGMRLTSAPEHLMRWVYAQTEGPRIARPVDVVFAHTPARRRLTVLSDGARNREALTSVDQAIPNTDACREYGGCPHHHSRGGPCSATRSIRSMIAMGFRQAYEQANGAGGAPATTETTTTTASAPPPVEGGSPGADQGEADARPPAPKPTAPSKAKASAKAPTGTLSALAQALAESEAAVLEATAKLDAAKDALRKALG